MCKKVPFKHNKVAYIATMHLQQQRHGGSGDSINDGWRDRICLSIGCNRLYKFQTLVRHTKQPMQCLVPWGLVRSNIFCTVRVSPVYSRIIYGMAMTNSNRDIRR